jgi:hypothetical protein
MHVIRGVSPAPPIFLFHSYPGQDDWRAENTGVEYHHILGVQHINQTIGRVTVQRVPVCVIINPGISCFDRDLFSPGVTNGDGTVPEKSATRIGSADLNAPGASLWYFFSLDDAHDGLVEHTALTQLEATHNRVLFILGKGPDPGPGDTVGRFLGHPSLRNTASEPGNLRASFSIPSRRVPVLQVKAMRAHHREAKRTVRNPQLSPNRTAATRLQEPSHPPAPAYYLTVTGVDFVSVTDDQGNSNTQIDDTFALRVPNVTYNLIGDKAVFVSMPTDKAYTITFRVGSDPLNVEILKGLDNRTPTQAVRYRDAVIPAGATAMLRITPEGIETLRYDADGNGTFESSVTPTVSLIGAAAADVTPPSVRVSGIPQPSNVLVTIAAQDGESSVKAVYYSLDRIHYQQYVGPFPVNPGQTSTVFAFADDNAANRSAMTTYTVPPAGTTISAVGPAQFWVGLKNSDDVGTKFDLLAEVFKNGALVGSGQLNDVLGGSSGFNNAKLDPISLALSGTPVFSPGDTIGIRLSVRVATSSGHRSGTARLWFNDTAANSRFTANFGGIVSPYFLLSGSNLGTAAGAGPKNTIDVLVDRAVGGNPFKAFGTWSLTF